MVFKLITGALAVVFTVCLLNADAVLVGTTGVSQQKCTPLHEENVSFNLMGCNDKNKKQD